MKKELEKENTFFSPLPWPGVISWPTMRPPFPHACGPSSALPLSRLGPPISDALAWGTGPTCHPPLPRKQSSRFSRTRALAHVILPGPPTSPSPPHHPLAMARPGEHKAPLPSLPPSRDHPTLSTALRCRHPNDHCRLHRRSPAPLGSPERPSKVNSMANGLCFPFLSLCSRQRVSRWPCVTVLGPEPPLAIGQHRFALPSRTRR